MFIRQFVPFSNVYLSFDISEDFFGCASKFSIFQISLVWLIQSLQSYLQFHYELHHLLPKNILSYQGNSGSL